MTIASRSRQCSRQKPLVRAVWLLPIVLLLVGAVTPLPARAGHWAPPSRVFVPGSGHSVDGLFLDVWRRQRHLLGDPITEEIRTAPALDAETAAVRVVQYFENAALVYTPDAPAEEQVRAIELGREALDRALSERPPATLVQASRRTACGSVDGIGCRGFAPAGHTLRGGFRAFWDDHEGDRWLGLPLTEAYRAPDRTLLQYFEGGVLRQRSPGEVAPLPLGREATGRLDLGTERIVRPNDVPVYSAALFAAPPEPEPIAESEPEPALLSEFQYKTEASPATEPLTSTDRSPAAFGPGPQQGGYKEIVVSISAQTLWAYEGEQLVNSTLVSTGTAEVVETTTPVGSWQILTKYDVQDMEGTISDEYYFVEDVPDVMYFDNLGNALHGTYWHNNFGTPMSHGCVNVPLDVAGWLYDWAPIGTAVTVIP